jgi:hypothetical protein
VLLAEWSSGRALPSYNPKKKRGDGKGGRWGYTVKCALERPALGDPVLGCDWLAVMWEGFLETRDVLVDMWRIIASWEKGGRKEFQAEEAVSAKMREAHGPWVAFPFWYLGLDMGDGVAQS